MEANGIITAPAAPEGPALEGAAAPKENLISMVRAYRRIGLPVTAAVVALTAFLPWLRVVGLINTNESLMDGGDGWLLLGGAGPVRDSQCLGQDPRDTIRSGRTFQRLSRLRFLPRRGSSRRAGGVRWCRPPVQLMK